MSSLAWKTTHGVSQRRLDAIETFFKLLSESGAPIEREHWAVSLALRLSFPTSITDPAPYLRRAWLVTRRLHPTIAGTVTAPSTDPADVNDVVRIISVGPLDDEAWLATTFRTVAPGDTNVANSTDLFAHGSVHPYEKAMCHWIAASSEVCIRAAHWRIDGVGMLMLAQSFLSALASVVRLGLEADLESYNVPGANGALTPSLHDLAGTPSDEDATPASFKAAADALIQELIRSSPGISLPTKPGCESDPPGATLREAITLDPATTAAVIAAARARGISVTSAVHAALVRVTAAFPQHPLAKSYVALSPADMRRYLPGPYNGQAYAVGCYCSGLPTCVPDLYNGKNGDAKSFDVVANQLNRSYRQNLNDMAVDEQGNAISMLALFGPHIRRTAKLVSTPPPPGLPPVQNADLSSFGVIEQYLQRDFALGSTSGDVLQLSDMWMGVEVTSRSVQCHAWTFRDRLSIQACYNETYYEGEFIDALLAKVKDELLTELGVTTKQGSIEAQADPSLSTLVGNGHIASPKVGTK